MGTVGAAAGAATAAGLSRLAMRYAAGVREADRSWHSQIATPLRDIGEVESVSVLPVVERLTVGHRELGGEPGVSYLIEAGGTRIIFDCGLSGGREHSVLTGNAVQLRIDLTAIDGVVISHLHEDHVGGLGAMRRHTFSFSKEAEAPRGLPAYVPTDMQHSRADIVPTTGPRVIAPGMVVLPPLPRAMFWLGSVAEQALVINVRGFGLVLVTGCGHPRIEQILAVTEQVLDIPIRAVIGGLHLPVHALGTPFIPQAVLGNPHWPWRPISEQDVAHVLAELDERGPRLVALSAHDSTPWTFSAFQARFGDRFRPLRVGEQIVIDAKGASSPTVPQPATAPDAVANSVAGFADGFGRGGL